MAMRMAVRRSVRHALAREAAPAVFDRLCSKRRVRGAHTDASPATTPAILPPVAAAEAFMGAWSDDDGTGRGMRMPYVRNADGMPMLTSLEDVFLTHEAMLKTTHCERLGGHGGYKLGWKANPFIAADELRLHAMYSPIFSGCFLPSGAEVSLSHHKIFCAEAEYGFVMGRTLQPRDEPYNQEEVWRAVRSFEPCIELCGARFTTAVAKASPYHLLADAMSNALVIRGKAILASSPYTSLPDALRVKNVVRLFVDGEENSSGTGAENPGDSPLGSLTWLVNDLTHRRRMPLEAGHLVIAGHACQVAFSSRPAPPSARTLPQAQVCGARVVPKAAVEFGAHTVLEAYFEGCGTVRATLIE
jgi:2-keto-4-pentenoate hydratase